jgi:hypothetical protein
MAIVLNGTTGITNDGGYTGDGVVFADTTPANTLVTTTGGNVGIGTASPSFALDIATASANIRVAPSTTTNNALTRYTNAGGTGFVGLDNSIAGISSAYALNVFHTGAYPVVFGTNGAERARIDSSGNLLVGTTVASVGTTTGCRIVNDSGVAASRMELASTATTNSGIGYSMLSTGAGAYRFYIGYGGNIYATSTSITGISDQRLKENIRDLDDGLDVVLALKPRKFDWKEGRGKGTPNDRGFIAQEFEAVLPDMIEQWLDKAPDGEEPYKAINANLIPTLVKAIQEQQAIITALTARVEALEGTQP